MMQQQPQPAQPGGPAGAQPQQQLSPQQLQQMQLISKQAMEVLLQSDMAESIVARAQSGDPMQVTAEITLQLLRQINTAATQAGQQVEMLPFMVASVQIISTIGEMLEAGEVLTAEELPQFVANTCKVLVETHNATVSKQQQPQGAA
jgi:hypothetical protein